MNDMYLRLWVNNVNDLQVGSYDLIPEGEHDKLQAENKRLNIIIDNRAEDMELKKKYEQLKRCFDILAKLVI